jgi:hypothetical protein
LVVRVSNRGWCVPDEYRAGVEQTSDGRMPCCVCGDPWTLESPDYVAVTLREPDDGMTQWLGAHAGCLRRVFIVQVEVAQA